MAGGVGKAPNHVDKLGGLIDLSELYSGAERPIAKLSPLLHHCHLAAAFSNMRTGAST
jgi:hypothetical protein